MSLKHFGCEGYCVGRNQINQDLFNEINGNGGQRGIRTLETVPRLHTFQACAFDHSATCPRPADPAVNPGRTGKPASVRI